MSSRSYAASLRCLAAKGLLKNARAPSPWWSTVPKPDPEASQSTVNGLSKSGSCRTGAVESACLRASKADVASGVHAKLSFLRRAVSGATSVP